MRAWAICKLKAGLAPCEGLIAKLGFASSRPCIGIVLAHPARNTIRLLCSSLSSSPSVQDLASQRRTNTFRRLLFGLCNCQPSPACVMKGSCASVGRTLVQLPHLKVSQLRKFQVPETNLGSVGPPLTASGLQLPILEFSINSQESFKHWKLILGLWTFLLSLQYQMPALSKILKIQAQDTNISGW